MNSFATVDMLQKCYHHFYIFTVFDVSLCR